MKDNLYSIKKILLIGILALFFVNHAVAQNHSVQQQANARERILLDKPWKFAIGHATDRNKDFNHATGYFSYLAKTGYGDGAASAAFDDRAWRTVSIPHDWAVEMPFDPAASHSHGYKALGPGFPQSSVGWYRHHFFIPETDLGKRIRVEFDGIQRAARIFVNGFSVGEENLGNVSQSYDVTAYLNYGGNNVIAVRADVSIEAGWYYEGAGINRHAWLLKTNPVHVDQYGTFVTTRVDGKKTYVDVQTTLVNEYENSAIENLPAVAFKRTHSIVDMSGNIIAVTKSKKSMLETGERITEKDSIPVKNPQLWSLENPYLYKLITRIEDINGKLLDSYETPFGIRTIEFHPDKGFFLNGKSVKLKGSNNHEDHAGVGTATPDALIEYRLQRLKSMGMNAYRASHAPASPALLDAADRLGMLVINETRLSGINEYHLNAVEHMIKRDRNHPSIILWSLGNEEWAIEGNIKGARIATSMQNFARKLDPTRLNTIAISGGWGGISTTIGVMGVNYIKHGDTDKQHKNYPWQVIVGTEETTTQQTRGIYVEDKSRAHMPPQQNGTSGGNAEPGWQHYASRDYLAGIFYWTGFDYRGEPNPYGFPAVASQFGILDSCGFPKDGYYYLKSWWTNEPVLHIFPHWNWKGREGEKINVSVNSNSEEVELLLNNKSLGKKTMPRNGHLEWSVVYAPGELVARSFVSGKLLQETKVATTDVAASIKLESHKNQIVADTHDVAVVNVSVWDKNNYLVPTAENNLEFFIEGPGKIIGVGNGNPSSHEADVMVESVSNQHLGEWKAPDPADSKTPVHFSVKFDRPSLEKNARVSLLLNALGRNQTATLNGKILYSNASPDISRAEIMIDAASLLDKNNLLQIMAEPFVEWRDREGLFQFHPASLRLLMPAGDYKRKVFNGLAQVIVQSTGDAGVIRLRARGEGLQEAILEIPTAKNP
jgi:beta-galactosidase